MCFKGTRTKWWFLSSARISLLLRGGWRGGKRHTRKARYDSYPFHLEHRLLLRAKSKLKIARMALKKSIHMSAHVLIWWRFSKQEFKTWLIFSVLSVVCVLGEQLQTLFMLSLGLIRREKAAVYTGRLHLNFSLIFSLNNNS